MQVGSTDAAAVIEDSSKLQTFLDPLNEVIPMIGMVVATTRFKMMYQDWISSKSYFVFVRDELGEDMVNYL